MVIRRLQCWLFRLASGTLRQTFAFKYLRQFLAGRLVKAIRLIRLIFVGCRGKRRTGMSTAPSSLAVGKDDPARYRQLVEAITDYAIYMLDPTGRIVSWNSGAERFKGYTADEIIGQHFSRFYTLEDKVTELPRRALETAAREGKFESEGWRVRKDGTRFWAHVIIDPIRDPDSGAITGFANITRDLTQRNAAADKLRRSEEQFRILVQG